MKVSVNIVQKLVGFELPPVNELVARINAQLGGVEEIIDLRAKYKDARIVKVVQCEKHPDADKLSVCLIDDGSIVESAKREEDGLVQVVCGAPNVHAGMWAVWLPPESVVPASFEDTEPFVLGARKLRGILSQGMLSAADELAIGSDHAGIVEITEADLPEGKKLAPGASFAEMFGLDSYVIDIENKMFTHRPDLFGQLGVAREIAGIFGKEFTSPDWYTRTQEFAQASGLELEVFNDAPESVPRFMATAIKDVEVKPSPLWLQCQLVAMGAKPINTIVDATNYIMLMTAQPTHAYDYDKLRGHKIGARMAQQGETVTLLNNKTYELTEDDIVIADGEGVIGLGGVMGGLDSEVTNETKNIVLEVANFDMYTIRKTSMRHGLFTDAVTRFNKGQSPLQNDAIMARLMDSIPGQQASQVFDPTIDKTAPSQMEKYGHSAPEVISTEFISKRLGLVIPRSEIILILRNVEFETHDDAGKNENEFQYRVPIWRTDIELPEDVVEEVGRLYGFDKLPRELPLRSTKPAPKNVVREAKKQVRESLRRAGANEVLTYSFVHENVLKRAEQDPSEAFKLSNALSPDLQYYRLSVLPSLLDKVHLNIKAGHDEFTLFEIGRGHNKRYHANDDDGLPKEINFVDAVYARKKPGSGAPFYVVRRLVDRLAKDLGCQLIYKPITEAMNYAVTAPFDLERSALIETTDGVLIGMIGELKQSVIKNFKLPEYVAAVTLDLEGLVKITSGHNLTYRPLSRYPSVSQDVSIRVSGNQRYDEVFEVVGKTAEATDLTVDVRPVSIYQPEDDPQAKTISFRLTFTSYDRTLSDKDISPIIKRLEQTVL